MRHRAAIETHCFAAHVHKREIAVAVAHLGVPFLLTGLAFGTVTSALSVVRRHYAVVIGAGGVVLIGMGVLIWTGEFTQLNITVNHWLQTLGAVVFLKRSSGWSLGGLLDAPPSAPAGAGPGAPVYHIKVTPPESPPAPKSKSAP